MKWTLTLVNILLCINIYSADLGTYDTLEEAKNSLASVNNQGDTFTTNGYFSNGDGGSGNYTIQENTSSTIFDSGSKIKLNDSFYAELNLPLINGYYELNVSQFGVEGVDNIASLHNGNDFSEINIPNNISIENIIRLMELSVFIKGDAVLSNKKVKISINKNSNNNVIPIANSWYITRGDIELEIAEGVTIYGDVTGYFEDKGYNGCKTGYSTKVNDTQNLSTHAGGTLVIADYGTSASEFLSRYIDLYEINNIDEDGDGYYKWHNICRDHKQYKVTEITYDSIITYDFEIIKDSKWIENIKVHGGGKISNFGSNLEDAVINDSIYNNGGNENGLSFHKTKNVEVENIIIEDIGRKAITFQPGGGKISIKDVTIKNAGYLGIAIEDSDDNISTNLVQIENVSIEKVRAGNAIYVKALPDNIFINNNEISDVLNPINKLANGIECYGNKSTIIKNNIIDNCYGTGIIFSGEQIEIDNNIIRNCSTGILFRGLEGEHNINDNFGLISNNQFTAINNQDITEWVSDPKLSGIDPDWKNITIENNKAIDDILNFNENLDSAEIKDNSPCILFSDNTFHDNCDKSSEGEFIISNLRNNEIQELIQIQESEDEKLRITIHSLNSEDSTSYFEDYLTNSNFSNLKFIKTINNNFIQLWDNDGKLGILSHSYINNVNEITTWTNSGGSENNGSSAIKFIPSDINNDNLTDITQLWNNDGKLGIVTFLGNENGTFGNGLKGDQFHQSWTNNGGSISKSNIEQYLNGDIDGNGKSDLIQLWDNNGKLGIVTYLGKENGSYGNGLTGDQFYHNWTNGGGAESTGSSAIKFISSDINNDDLSDITQLWDNNGKLGIVTYLANENGTFGNGLTGNQFSQSWTNNGGSISKSNIEQYLNGDIDGDGKSDLIQLWNNNGKLGIVTYRGKENGSYGNGLKGDGFYHTWTNSGGSESTGSSAIKFISLDINNDNRSDLIQLWDNIGSLGIIIYLGNDDGSLGNAKTADDFLPNWTNNGEQTFDYEIESTSSKEIELIDHHKNKTQIIIKDDVLKIDHNSLNNDKIEINLWSLETAILNKIFPVNKGENQLNIPIAYLATGIYILNISTSSIYETIKIIIK